MGSFLEDLALKAITAVAGRSGVNEFLIDKLVDGARNRPHPWSTRYDYICWDGLTDRSYNARLLPANRYPDAEAMRSRRPPENSVAALFIPGPGGQRPCAKSTCLFPAFAQYLTDGFIRTQLSNDDALTNRRRTTSNHEIDLSALYGRTRRQTDVLRLRSETAGRKGRLKTQTVGGEEWPPFLYRDDGSIDPHFLADDGSQILDPPLGLDHATPEGRKSLFAVGGDRANAAPQVTMVNTLFLREHNRLAAMLDAQNPGWDDERVFQIARNILIFMFIKIVVEEYINHINTSAFRFRADPEVAWEADWNRPNWMTAEFSLLYRWHSLVPETLVWGGATLPGAGLLLDNRLVLRDGLATSFAEISANNAMQIGLHNSASFLIRAETKAVEQARVNHIDGYNAYRAAMGLDRAESFRDIVGKSKNAAEDARRKALAGELEALYGTPDNVEFYVGLFAEPVGHNGPLPDLILAMVAMDAFSQALTNPLLSRHVYGDPANRELTFTAKGLEAIEATRTLRDILTRNARGLGERFVGMTRRDWRRD